VAGERNHHIISRNCTVLHSTAQSMQYLAVPVIIFIDTVPSIDYPNISTWLHDDVNTWAAGAWRILGARGSASP
jgi:hypothetical protein